MISPEEWERLRHRWLSARRKVRLDSIDDDDFGLGGLARHAPEVRVRFLILPSDPGRAFVEFDEAMWEWWKADWPNPFEGASRTEWDNFQIPTTEAAVRAYRWGDDRWRWDDYLALHRNGGLEFGLGRLGTATFQRQFEDESTQIFFLTTIVGRAWWSLSRYSDVTSRYELEGPYEICLAFKDTLRSGLGNVAAGWEEPQESFGRDFPKCPDRNVLIIRTVETWPGPEQLQSIAFSLGANVEDAWGCQQRRFISRVEPNPGEFDVSRYR